MLKVEKILKGILVSISSPSPSVKIQIMGGKFCLRCRGKTLFGVVNKLLKAKSLLTSPSELNKELSTYIDFLSILNIDRQNVCFKPQYKHYYSKLLLLCRTHLNLIEQHALYSRFLSRPARKEWNVPNLKII